MQIQRSQRKTRKEKKHFQRTFYIYTAIIIVLIVGFLVAMNRPHFAFSSIQVQGQKTFMEKEIHDFAEQYIEGKYFGIIPRNNFLVFNTRRFTRALEQTFSRLDNISTTIEQGDILVIMAGERSAHSLWCIEREYDSPFDEECFYADKEGVFYAPSPYFSGNIYFKIFFPDHLLKEGSLVGQSIYTPDEFKDFFAFLDTLEKTFDVTVSSVLLVDSYDVQIFLSRIKETTYRSPHPYILFQRDELYETILRNIDITLNFDVFKKDFQQKASFLESIDVRFPGRIFYTFN